MIYKKRAKEALMDDELVEFAGKHYFHEMAKSRKS